MEIDNRFCGIREFMHIKLLSRLVSGDIIKGRVVDWDDKNAYVDIGGSLNAILPAERIALSPALCSPNVFFCGQEIYAAVFKIDRRERRIYLSHRELLGTFEELTRGIKEGDVLKGKIVGDNKVLLSPNLTAHAANTVTYSENTSVIARIKDLLPGKAEITVEVNGIPDTE